MASFLATAIPALSFSLMSYLEPASTNEHNIFNQGVWQGLFMVATVSPYFVAIFIDSERGAKICYWVALVLTQVALTSYIFFYMVLHRNRPKAVRYAVNLEAMIEKFNVLALIVLGESLMAMLFEGSELLAKDGVKVPAVFNGVFLGAIIVYSIQTLYFNVDNFVVKGAVHPIRHSKWNGLAWAQMHFFYFMALGGFLSTGIGLMLRDIGIPPTSDAAVTASATKEGAAHMVSTVVRAAGGSTAGIVHFDRKARWLFSGAWMTVMLLSSLMGLLYKAGPRGRTKNSRLILRIVIVLGLGIGMPFTDVPAEANLTIFAYASLFFALVEFICIQMDRIGMLSWSGKPISVTTGSAGNGSSGDSGDFDSEDEDIESGKGVGEVDEHDVDDATAAARRIATERQQRHRRRFETISHPVLAFRNAAHQ